MSFGLRKKPAKVFLLGLAGFGIYFAIAVSVFRDNEYYLMILGGGFFGVALLAIKSIGSFYDSVVGGRMSTRSPRSPTRPVDPCR